ncbi:extracellular solute-binding protein [Rhodospirillaceae bacterium SYSU D60014]|uniref:ABC transporter substrate-binding protein n=1 Tax=Virgifigura deserti TaxID=2268457 RepID=UPI000E66779E
MLRSPLPFSPISRRRLLGAGAALAATGAVGLPRRARAAEELNALVWCDHTDAALLQPFEEAFDCRINIKDYQETGAALAILEQSQPGDWDVIVVDSVDVLPKFVSQGLLAELPDDEMPWDTIFPELRAPELHYAGGKLYAVPEKFGYNAIAYNNKKVDSADVRRADIMWNPDYAGRIAIYDYYIPAMEMVALGMGIKPQDLTADNLPKIRNKLLEMKQLAAVIGDVPTVQNALITGAADIIVAGGEFVVAGLSGENAALDWTIPESGGIRWMQGIGVFADSTRKDLATEFVKYIVGPEGQAQLATASCYWAMPANRSAALGDAEKARLRWDEQLGFIANSYPYFIPDAELDAQMLEVWTEFLQA